MHTDACLVRVNFLSPSSARLEVVDARFSYLYLRVSETEIIFGADDGRKGEKTG